MEIKINLEKSDRNSKRKVETLFTINKKRKQQMCTVSINTIK